MTGIVLFYFIIKHISWRRMPWEWNLIQTEEGRMGLDSSLDGNKNDSMVCGVYGLRVTL